jgi:two-component system, NtrC family, response regulator HupR/HoxA
MSHPPRSDWTDRQPRIPLCLPVFAGTELVEAWLTNLSATGLSLNARVAHAGSVPVTGAKLELELLLPDRKEAVALRGEIAWVKASAGRVSLGLRFTSLAAPVRALLAQYVARYRPHLAILLASEAEEQLCRRALQSELFLHFIRSDSELHDVLSRGDVSVVLVFGRAESEALEAVADVLRATLSSEELGPGWGSNPCLIVAGPVSAESTLQLHNGGRLFESLSPPVTQEQLHQSVQRAARAHAIRSELTRESQQAGHRTVASAAATKGGEVHDALEGIAYQSPPMKEAITLLQTVAGHRLPVLLLGETGTGKELLARALHGLSDRATAPFVAQDCGVLTETLLESELFGHARGAFTGAVTEHMGLFQVAEGGTVFLDEIENTSPGLQAKLLRVIETGEIRPVGSARSLRVDVRIVAASNRDLQGEAEAGRFRSDLFYRLSPFPIELPPLRERAGDVLLLAREFLRRASAGVGRDPQLGFTPSAEGALQAHRWPGNVRELKNVIDRAVLLAPREGPVDVVSFPKALQARSAGPVERAGPLKERVLAFEGGLIREALARHQGIIRRAAQELGVNPVTLARRARQLGLLEPA